jgi:hypothetical protein
MREMSSTQFEVSVWNPASKKELRREWTLPFTTPYQCLSPRSVLFFEESDVGVIHVIVLGANSPPNVENHLFFGISTVEEGPIKDLWNDFTLSPGGRCQVHRKLLRCR